MFFHSICRMNYYSRLCDFAFIAISLSFLHLVTELIKGRFIRTTLKVVLYICLLLSFLNIFVQRNLR